MSVLERINRAFCCPTMIMLGTVVLLVALCCGALEVARAAIILLLWMRVSQLEFVVQDHRARE